MDGDIPRLANAELTIMELLWREGAMTARQIRERVYPGKDRPQHGTVQRLLLRLEEKGVVARDRRLPVHVFSAVVSREAYAGSQLEAIAHKLTGGSLTPLVSYLIDNKKITKEELDRLRRLLDGHSGPG